MWMSEYTNVSELSLFYYVCVFLHNFDYLFLIFTTIDLGRPDQAVLTLIERPFHQTTIVSTGEEGTFNWMCSYCPNLIEVSLEGKK